MPIEVGEMTESRGLGLGSNNHYYRSFKARGSSDEAAIATAVLVHVDCPVTVTKTVNTYDFEFIRDDIQTTPIPNAGEPTLWDVKVTYKLLSNSSNPYQAGDQVFSFEIGFQQVNVKQSKQTIGIAGDTPRPDFKKMINVTPTAIEGVDVDVPTFSFSITTYMKNEDVDEAYIDGIWNIANAPVNDAPFQGFDAGEVKFLGCQGQRRNRLGDWEITFKFAVSPNITGLTVPSLPDDFTDIDKEGWQYLWIWYKEIVQDFGGKKLLVSMPEFVILERLFDYSDFDALGL